MNHNINIQHQMKQLNIEKLTPEQMEILPHILNRKDVIVMLPTGAGKSLLWQIPYLQGKIDETTVVLSPLKALQQDQLENLSKRLEGALERGVLIWKGRALLNSDLSKQERQNILEKLSQKRLQLLFLAPEQLFNPETSQALSQANIVRVVVDEAHVLTGCDEGFRPAYSKIGDWIETLPHKPQIIALSATLTKGDLSLVEESLSMKKPKIFRYPMKRDNLKITVKEIEKATTEIVERQRFQSVEFYLDEWKSKGAKGSVIIYCTTVNKVNELNQRLKARKWKCSKYHGKMKQVKRDKNMSHFMSGKCPIMVATSAFGMGIDKPDIRLVIHASPPLTLSDYVQQFGRAGRDGKKAQCVLFYTSTDWATCKRVLGKKQSDKVAPLQELVKKDKFKWGYVEKYFGEN